jgi:hypothetical protein
MFIIIDSWPADIYVPATLKSRRSVVGPMEWSTSLRRQIKDAELVMDIQ